MVDGVDLLKIEVIIKVFYGISFTSLENDFLGLGLSIESW